MTTQIKNTFGIVENGTIKMTSIEIADMVGCEHKNVKRSIERLMESGVIQLTPMENCGRINGLGLTQNFSYYVFEGEQGRLDATILVAQLSPTFTAQLVYRWSELEKEVERLKQISLLPDFTNPAIAARAWADEVDQKIMAQLEARERSEVADAKTLPYPMSHLIGGTNKQAGEATLANLKSILKDSNNAVSSYIVGDDGKLAGRPIASSGIFGGDEMLVGDFSGVMIGEWDGLTLDVDPWTEARNGGVCLRLFTDLDWTFVGQDDSLIHLKRGTITK